MVLAAWDIPTASGAGIDLVGKPGHGDEVFLSTWANLPARPGHALDPVRIEVLMRLPVGALGGASFRGHGSSLRKLPPRVNRAAPPLAEEIHLPGKSAGAAPEGGVGAAPDI